MSDYDNITQPLVALQKCPDYDRQRVLAAIIKLLEPLGSITRFVKPGMRVLLKPNLVIAATPERAVTTHPSVVWAVGKLAVEAGAKVIIGDSPGYHSGLAAGTAAGLVAVSEELGLDWVEFTESREVYDPDRLFKRLELANQVLDADLVINLPKCKTHGMMLLTLAVKNCFGAVCGKRKAAWHCRAGSDPAVFAQMIVEVATAVNPGLSIVDAIVSMDGDGPNSGNPNTTEFLVAGTDPFAVDAVICDILGVSRDKLWILTAASKSGNDNWRSSVTAGATVKDLQPKSWEFPVTHPLMRMHKLVPDSWLPFLTRFFRRLLTARPEVDANKCKRCSRCIDACPPQAMRLSDSGAGVEIDSVKCIRCYCCHELCPFNAVKLQKPFGRRIIK